MVDHVYKTTDIIGTSRNNPEEAIRVAIERASKTVHNLRWFKVVEIRGNIDGSTIEHWQVSLQIGFTLD
jgi:flavin-binding protein dodecin